MTPELSELEHLLDAAEVLREIQSRRPAVALFQSDAALAADGRGAVFRGRYDGAPAVLTLFLGEDRAERARQHKRDLARIEAASAAGRYRVAPMLGSWPGEGVIVTADVAGERLDRALAAADDVTRDALIAEAGRWLAHLAAQANRQVAFGGRHWVRVAQKGLSRATGGADDALAQVLSTRLEALLPTVAGKTVTQAHCHGDFAPANLVRTAEALWGVALGNGHWLPVVKDAAHFLVVLHLASPRTGGQTRFGVGGADLEALLGPLELLLRRERALHLPFFIGLELAAAFARTGRAAPEADLLRASIADFLAGDGRPLL